MRHTTIIHRLAAFALAGGWLVQATARAAEPGMEALLDMPLEGLMQVQVTVASRYAEDMGTAPALVTVLDRDRFEAMGITRLADLLNYVPGFHVTHDSNIATRTPVVNARGHHNARILLLLDGKRVNGHNTSTPFLFQRLYSLHNIQRVEVMRGPGSSIYGSAAFVGIVNLVTRDAPDEVGAETGSHGHRQLVAARSLAGRDWGLSLYGRVQGDDGERYHGLFDRFGRTTGRSRAPRDQVEAQLKGRFRDLDFQVYHTRTRAEDFYQFGALGNGINEDEARLSLFDLSYRPELFAGVDSRFSVGYRRYEADQVSVDTPTGVGPFTAAPLVIGPAFTHEVLSADIHFVHDRLDGHRLSWGASYERAESPQAAIQANYDLFDPAVPYLGGVREFDDDALRFIRDVRREVTGVYLQDDYQWQAWTVAAGLRHDEVSDVGGHVSPKLAVTYRAGPQHAFKAVYGEAFQAPVMSRLYNQNNPATQGNPELRPERIRTLSLSYLHDGPGRQAEATLFVNRIRDMTQRVSGADGASTFANVGEQETAGLELSGAARLGGGWNGRLTYTRYLRNDFEADTDLLDPPPDAFTADWLVSGGLDWRGGPWQADLNGHVAGPVDALPDQGTVAVVNAAAAYQPETRWRYYLRVHNLLDEAYDAPALGSGLGTDATGDVVRPTPERGRWVFAGVLFRF